MQYKEILKFVLDPIPSNILRIFSEWNIWQVLPKFDKFRSCLQFSYLSVEMSRFFYFASLHLSRRKDCSTTDVTSSKSDLEARNAKYNTRLLNRNLYLENAVFCMFHIYVFKEEESWELCVLYVSDIRGHWSAYLWGCKCLSSCPEMSPLILWTSSAACSPAKHVFQYKAVQ